jgi:predicted Zn finger-like uncharacterized protein
VRFACPQCDAAYSVPDSMLIAAPKVRCVRCGHEWVLATGEDTLTVAPREPDLEEDTPTAPHVPEADEFQRDAAQPAVRDEAPNGPDASPTPPIAEPGAATAVFQQRRLAAAWVASVAALILALGAGAIWREQVMEVWPPSGRLFGWLHLPPPSR